MVAGELAFLPFLTPLNFWKMGASRSSSVGGAEDSDEESESIVLGGGCEKVTRRVVACRVVKWFKEERWSRGASQSNVRVKFLFAGAVDTKRLNA